MILIFLSWVYILTIAINFGILFRLFFGIQNCHIIIHQVLGLFLYTIITSVFAFFTRIHIEYYLGILTINILIAYIYRNRFKFYINALVKSIRELKTNYKLLYLFLFFIILAQSSTQPYLLDNESYYIQTIKWLNEYGYVKGLANLHMFLGQNSAWHALQAGLNFPFFSIDFNDLNGFLFVIIGYLAIEKLNNYKPRGSIQDFAFGMILIFSLFLMQFINSPSPDLIIFLLAPYVFYLFIIGYKNMEVDDFKIILSLVLFLCFVKVTMGILSILVIILFIKHFNTLKNKIIHYFILSGGILILFLLKNAIVSGYLIYPIQSLDILDVNWKQPKILLEFYNNGTYLAGMNNNADVSTLNVIERFKYWISIPKLHGVFNKIYILFILIFPWFIVRSKDKSSMMVIYTLAILQFIVLWNTSPQYRFFFIFIIFLSIQFFISIIKHKSLGVSLVYLSIIASAFPVFFNINLNTFTNNHFSMTLSQFKLRHLVVPERNSKTVTSFNKHTINGFEFNSPDDDVFFWSTGNGNIPCVNKKQIDYIMYYYNYIPQQRSKNLADGFKSILIEKEVK
ncbi:LIC_10190 family membrane protein [Flavivirga rizhaonensis]|uniref:DUF8201 domain-containing protein n=1 Tax=Flavivirga rizhaonensis TaxID=2559571 RepID=A0A4S1E2I5_9FLAO|nr:hypothetical protein [Flavivirga rizhaonensis]TGV04563.1 hypothetical protein EM932_00090 [Flavivirga rizhaonensis]